MSARRPPRRRPTCSRAISQVCGRPPFYKSLRKPAAQRAISGVCGQMLRGTPGIRTRKGPIERPRKLEDDFERQRTKLKTQLFCRARPERTSGGIVIVTRSDQVRSLNSVFRRAGTYHQCPRTGSSPSGHEPGRSQALASRPSDRSAPAADGESPRTRLGAPRAVQREGSQRTPAGLGELLHRLPLAAGDVEDALPRRLRLQRENIGACAIPRIDEFLTSTPAQQGDCR